MRKEWNKMCNNRNDHTETNSKGEINNGNAITVLQNADTEQWCNYLFWRLVAMARKAGDDSVLICVRHSGIWDEDELFVFDEYIEFS